MSSAADLPWRTGRLVATGMLTLLAVFAVLGYWGTQARIVGAVVASGQIEVRSHRQVVQHPDGGIVSEILVKDGDTVEAGQVLLRIDGAATAAQLSIAEAQLSELRARATRLRALEDGAPALTFDADLLDKARTDPQTEEILRGQENQFRAQMASRDAATAAMRNQQQQIQNEIAGQVAQNDAGSDQIALVQAQLADQTKLLSRGLALASQVLDLRREEARLRGASGETSALIARNREKMAELDVEILKIGTTLRETAVGELRDVVTRESELRRQIEAYRLTLSRLDLRAPMGGVVYDLQVHSINAVIKPADPVLYIVPQSTDLVVTARVDALHVDSVHAGQQAMIRFPAFDMRTTPDFRGKVTRLAPDVLQDQRTGANYYEITVTAQKDALDKVLQLGLRPGMPAQVFIRTGERSPLSYFAKPLTDYFETALRE